MSKVVNNGLKLENTFTRLFISLLATHYGRIAILVHLGLALCLDPALASSSPSSVSQPGMFHGQLQTHISSSKNVPSWCLGSYTIKMSISFHLTGLEPSMTHLALAKGVFTGSLMSLIYRRQMKHGWFHLCEKSILGADMLLARYFWMSGWVNRRRKSSRHFPL